MNIAALLSLVVSEEEDCDDVVCKGSCLEGAEISSDGVGKRGCNELCCLSTCGVPSSSIPSLSPLS